jgi:hypothetical protein
MFDLHTKQYWMLYSDHVPYVVLRIRPVLVRWPERFHLANLHFLDLDGRQG